MDEHPHVPLQPYRCEDIVYRAIPYLNWATGDGKGKEQVYKRRARDTHGLSISPTCSDCRNSFRQPIGGMVSFHVWTVARSGPNVNPDSPTHGNIENVPWPDEYPIESRNLALDLRELARPVPNWESAP